MRIISLTEQQKLQLRKALEGTPRLAPILPSVDRAPAAQYGSEMCRLLAPLRSKYLQDLDRRKSA